MRPLLSDFLYARCGRASNSATVPPGALVGRRMGKVPVAWQMGTFLICCLWGRSWIRSEGRGVRAGRHIELRPVPISSKSGMSPLRGGAAGLAQEQAADD